MPVYIYTGIPKELIPVINTKNKAEHNLGLRQIHTYKNKFCVYFKMFTFSKQWV